MTGALHVLFAAALAASLIAPALIAPVASAAPPELSPEARVFADRGAEAFKDGRFPDAAARFREAYTVQPRAWLLFNAGLALERAEHLAEAIDAYEGFVTSADAKARAVKDARRALKELRRRLKKEFRTVRLGSSPPGASVRSLGEAFPRSLGTTPVVAWLPRGAVTLHFERDGYQPLEHKATVAGSGASIEVTLEAVPAEVPDPEPTAAPPDPVEETASPPPAAEPEPAEAMPEVTLTAQAEPNEEAGFTVPVATWITGGLAVGAAGVGIGLGVEALALESATKRYSQQAGATETEWKRRRGEANDMALGSSIAWGVAGASAVTAVVLLFVLQPDDSAADEPAPAVGVAPWLAPHAGGVWVSAGGF